MALLRKILATLLSLSLAWAGLFLHAPVARAQSPAPREYAIKAAFLYNFAQFVEWPTEAFGNSNAPFVIGVLGANPFGGSLDDIVRGEAIRGHPVEVRYLRSSDPITDCHVLFVSQSENSQFENILQKVAGKPILTVGDMDRFARRGGMIRFTNLQNKIRFIINPEAAKAAGLGLSSKLLRLGELVATDPR